MTQQLFVDNFFSSKYKKQQVRQICEREGGGGEGVCQSLEKAGRQVVMMKMYYMMMMTMVDHGEVKHMYARALRNLVARFSFVEKDDDVDDQLMLVVVKLNN